MELKFSPAACEISGYASVWMGAADAVGDLVAPGAFTASIARSLPEMKREHGGPEIGRWTLAEEDATGLKLCGVVTDLKTISDLREGRIDGLSIGFVEKKSSTNAAGNRVLEAVDLHEVSLVKRPAKNSTRVLSIKSCLPRKVKQMADNTVTSDNCDPVDDNAMDGRVSALETSVADISTRLGKLEGSASAQTKSLANIETALRRPGAVVAPEAKPGEVETKSFVNFCRRGVERIEAVEAKSLRVSDDTAGGYLAPDQFVKELLRNVVLFSPIRGIARVSTTGSQNVLLPKRTGTLSANWVEDVGARTGTSPTYGQAQFPVRELACYTDVSNSLLEDAAFDLASELALDFAENFGKLEGTAFVSGDGVGKPFGFMSDTSLLSTVSGGASAITADGLIQLYHDLPAPYRGNATWVMNASTLAAVRKLKDGTTSQYLLTTAGQFGGTPMNMLFGRPVVEAVDMPDIAGNAYPIAFGDFQAGYRVFDRLSLSVLRDPYSQQSNGLVRFHARRRVAGGVAKAEAIRKLKIST